MYYYWWGMNGIWWIIWIILLVWIFAIPYGIPGQRFQKDTPLDILKKRLARGEISKETYEDLKGYLEMERMKNASAGQD